jgi:hypothetical protein
MRRLIFTITVIWMAMASPITARADVPEPGSLEDIANATTEKRFLSPWTASLPASSTVPSPRAFLHRIPGAAGELANSATAYAYFEALAQASPRVKLFTIGRSEEGRDIKLLAIADEDGIGHLDTLKAASAALADPRRTDESQAIQLIESARPIYYFNAGLHSDETGSTESVMELAYRLAVSDTAMISRIRSQLIVLINPVSSPDGRDKQVDWFYTYLKGKTDRATLPRQSPPYWSKYAFVDINRDAHQQTHETTKAVHLMFFDWHPTIVHDLHESVALLMTWNGTGPYNPNIDPITYSEFQEMSFHEVQALTGLGMPGVSTWNFGEGFSHLFLESIAMNHNAIGRGYETFGNGTAETLQWQLAPQETSTEWYRLLPPPTDTFSWSARDNINYNETAALAALDFTAAHSKELLVNFYHKGYHSWQKGLHEAPYAFIIPADQGDPARVATLVGRLLGQHIEVYQARDAFSLIDGAYPKGTYVVRLDQPYRNYAVDLLTPQHYPKDGGEPYDDVSWSLATHYHLTVIASADPKVRALALDPVIQPPLIKGGLYGHGELYLLKDTGQEGLLEARFALGDLKVNIAEHEFTADGEHYPAGSWIIEDQPGTQAALDKLTQTVGLSFMRSVTRPAVRIHSAPRPRVGVWVPWADTDSIGWVRYSLDQRHIPYIYLRDEDIRAGHLKKKIDVLLYGHVDLELAEQIQGIPRAWGPMPFKRTTSTPSFGSPASSEDITGGIGGLGLQHISDFIEGGGLFITLGNGTMLALESGLVRGVRRDLGGVPRNSQGAGGDAAAASSQAVTRTPGAHLKVHFTQPSHPIAYGYPTDSYVFRQNFPLYSVPRRWLTMAYCNTCLDGPIDMRSVIMQWGASDNSSMVVSGQAWGESGLAGRPAIMDFSVGKGHVVTFNFNPLHRDMNRGDQRLLWNALINWHSIVTTPESAPTDTRTRATLH